MYPIKDLGQNRSSSVFGFTGKKPVFQDKAWATPDLDQELPEFMFSISLPFYTLGAVKLQENRLLVSREFAPIISPTGP